MDPEVAGNGDVVGICGMDTGISAFALWLANEVLSFSLDFFAFSNITSTPLQLFDSQPENVNGWLFAEWLMVLVVFPVVAVRHLSSLSAEFVHIGVLEISLLGDTKWRLSLDERKVVRVRVVLLDRDDVVRIVIGVWGKNFVAKADWILKSQLLVLVEVATGLTAPTVNILD